MANKYFDYFTIVFLLLLSGLIFVDIIIVNKSFLRKIIKLHGFMENVAKSKDTSLRVHISGNDEFSELGKSANNMLSELDAAYKDIKAMEERFRIIMEATNDAYMDLYPMTRELYISSEWKKLMGIETEYPAQLFEEYLNRIHPECFNRLKQLYLDLTKCNQDYVSAEYRLIDAAGKIIWVLHRGKVVDKDDKGNALKIVSTLFDITMRKKYEEEILDISHKDRLTGLRNRAFVETKFEELDSKADINYTIVTGDVNGLKLTNDTFGHREGDKVLISIASILRKCSSEDDIVARWGGDDFVILIVNKNDAYVTQLCSKIRETCNSFTGLPFRLSISLGSADKDENHIYAETVMNLAEERMYRNKLVEQRSVRSAAIISLERTLHEKHSETEEHTTRIRDLSVKLGRELGLPQEKLDELELLAALHDIGKIGIPDYILMKPDKLTDEEWSIMKTHTEIGYRIASSTPELKHIAQEILSHHERYDGTGYPQGLKGEEIPILSRIINIVDAFDVMTHIRTYKEAYSVEYAIEELKRCSGTQFDPNIVEVFLRM